MCQVIQVRMWRYRLKGKEINFRVSVWCYKSPGLVRAPSDLHTKNSVTCREECESDFSCCRCVTCGEQTLFVLLLTTCKSFWVHQRHERTLPEVCKDKLHVLDRVRKRPHIRAHFGCLLQLQVRNTRNQLYNPNNDRQLSWDMILTVSVVCKVWWRMNLFLRVFSLWILFSLFRLCHTKDKKNANQIQTFKRSLRFCEFSNLCSWKKTLDAHTCLWSVSSQWTNALNDRSVVWKASF